MLAFMSPHTTHAAASSTAPPLQSPPHAHAYAPTRSSPLTPRDPNAHLARRPFSFAYTGGNTAMDAQPQSSQGVGFGKTAASPTQAPAQAPATPFARRDTKPNPLIQRSGSDAVRNRRRDMFLRRVANDRDERRWAARSDQILRLDYVQRQRRWEAEQARRAPAPVEPPSDEDEEEEDNDHDMDEQDAVVGSSQASEWAFRNASSQQSLEQEAEMLAQQEDAELEALLANMEEDEGRDDDGPTFASDDDEYDTIFDECMSAIPANGQLRQSDTSQNHDDDMDMSTG
ncbi:hypothetical protein HDK90DRAFT_528660 [Phyllosticta capitalensis]|uniref:Uncharacterized protein n=1 Tax=Phyllosticta capitalensis TaxID=121624 RepID=A0ABR1YBB2_9PEZI